ncbi:MAG: capsule assembly Wzi family protein [Treponema brennaborense]|nr:capsule assembly Wzi family protein [Treponema brennaborense]
MKIIRRYRRTLSILCAASCIFAASAQEALKSAEEEYYDFLSLQGIAARPSLNYRTLSDSVWKIRTETEDSEDELKSDAPKMLSHPWAANNLGTTFTLLDTSQGSSNRYLDGVRRGIAVRIYGPDWYNSFNTSVPHGQNDGALWQGKGYNTSLTAGARLEAYGLEVTFKPQISWSQNLAFELMQSNCDSEFGYFWGYAHNVGADAPQRFGDEPFFTFDWGDTEIRYTWHTLTAGFGTQAVWLGPAYLNPILHSNNAPTYPKFDIGLRRQRVVIPGLNWYLGDVEARVWIGYLSQSDYFTDAVSNPHNQMSCFTFSYAPSFLPGLTLGAAKVCLSKWGEDFWKYLNPLYDSNEEEDQKASIMFDWVFPAVGFEVYGELGIDDYANESVNFEHTMVYTVGLKKTMPLLRKYNIYGELMFEWNNTEMSQDFHLQWPYNFGMHHVITQGYTNKGQWIGSGIGYGGDSQYIGYAVYFPRGKVQLYFHRFRPDNNYLYSKAITEPHEGVSLKELADKYFNRWETHLIYGISGLYFITPHLSVSGSFAAEELLMFHYKSSWDIQFCFSAGIKYSF